MKIPFELDAEFREDQGKGASRRLRHLGKVRRSFTVASETRARCCSITRSSRS